jgi:lipopolysaccharide/colanic/teichoic acid biosynthesis glycosyltransferase
VAAGRRLASLAQLRETLAACGLPAHDILVNDGLIDLSCECGLLRANEAAVRELAQATSASSPGDGVWRGHACRIHPTTRLFGPIVLQDKVVLEAGTTVIGPSLVGAGSRIQRGTLLAQCVVVPRSVIAPESTARNRLILHRSSPRRAALLPASSTGPPHAFEESGAVLGEAEPAAASHRAGRLYPVLKRIVDLAFATAGLVLLAPFLAVVATLIKLTSRGPVLFADTREGLDGREFRCWKFRTMIDGAHRQQRELYRQNQVDGPQFKLRGDPRITRVGPWLRSTNIDELPQLINVVLGQMSLIGPRPSPFRENQICVPWRKARLSVRPGITGLWQICRTDRSAGDFHQWIYYDMLYVRHMSLLLDLKIVLATIVTLAGRWSVPLRWLIQTAERHDAPMTLPPTRAPILMPAPPDGARARAPVPVC